MIIDPDIQMVKPPPRPAGLLLGGLTAPWNKSAILRLLFTLEQGFEIGKRPVGRRRRRRIVRSCPFIPFLIQMARVFVVVAVKAQQLPVAAVGGIVVVVVIPMVDGEFTQALAFKLPSASRTDRREDFKRLIPIALLPLLPVAPGLGDDLVLSIGVQSFFIHDYVPTLIKKRFSSNSNFCLI